MRVYAHAWKKIISGKIAQQTNYNINMKIILLSGGSGQRLWPLSNGAQAKQFLRLLKSPDGEKESMVQRVVRQIKEAGLLESITVATSAAQADMISNQLSEYGVDIVTEPARRDTFPAIALAAAYLQKEKHCPADETVVVMPCDPYTESGYFQTIAKMVKAVEAKAADLVLMGITPTNPSSKFGYIVPQAADAEKDIRQVHRFVEKPKHELAEQLLTEGALWNGGVFAFRLGYITSILDKYVSAPSFAEVRSRYQEFPKISFDYEVAERAESVAVIPFTGQWKDLGTWNALTEELPNQTIGKVVLDPEAKNTHVVNELSMPLICLGTDNLVVAASSDGILVADKAHSEELKTHLAKLGPDARPMYEERRWGEYKVIDHIEFPDGQKVLTKQLCIKAGKNISYQVHHQREEVWTIINGTGRVVLSGEERIVKAGDVVHVRREQFHAIRAITDLYIIEVQSGERLTEDDITRYPYNWE